MQQRTKKVFTVLFAVVMLAVIICFASCSPYSGNYKQVSAEELESKSEELEKRVNQTVNSLLYKDAMPNYKTTYSLSEKTDYVNDDFCTEIKVDAVTYGYEGLVQTKIEYHEIELVNDLEFTLLGKSPILEEYNFTVTFWYGDKLEHTYYEIAKDGKKEQGIMPYDFGMEELKKASNYSLSYKRYIKHDIETALTFDYDLYFDGENKIKVDSKSRDTMENWTILANLIFNDDDTVYFKEEQEHNQKVIGNIDWKYSSKSSLEITPSNKRITLPAFAK